MARPRKSTKDEWLDQFADWDTETQESLIDTCELLHRQAKRRDGRRPEPHQIEMRQHVTREIITDETHQITREDLGKAGPG